MIPMVQEKSRNVLYAAAGFVLGIVAPVMWTVIRLLVFPDPNQSLYAQAVGDVLKSPYNMVLYGYMGFGTAIVMALLGFILGKANDELHSRASELASLHREVAAQKEVFENRYKVLDNNIKNFHSISSRIQNSIRVREVLNLCAEGLHDILGYERVNILMVDDEKENLHFVTSTGSTGFDTEGVTLPLDERSGVIYKSWKEKKLYLIDDIANYPAEFNLQPPFNAIKPLRSRSFVLCPIVVKGESVGIFGIDNKFSHRSLNDTDVDTIKLFADQAASAITKINLLDAISSLIAELDKTFVDLLRNRDIYTRSFNSLEDSVEAVNDSTGRIATASESVMASVDDTSSAVAEISVAIDQVSHNLEFLAESIEKSVSTMEEINSSIKVVEQSAGISHDITRKVKEESDKARGVVQETISALDEIQRSVDDSYEGIRKLSDNSGRIDGIVNVINDITKRTNLLALNASIIAAQAGEYGKSFGVVADEIRNLSLQTGQSTGEITGIIDEILEESRSAARNITDTKELVAKGVQYGRKMSSALDVIAASSDKSIAMTQEIKTATEEQAKSVQFITRSIEDISSMSSQISRASREQNNGVKNIVQAIDSIKDLSQDMVRATARQVESGVDIRKSLEDVSIVFGKVFEDMEKRRAESRVVVGELDLLKEKSA